MSRVRKNALLWSCLFLAWTEHMRCVLFTPPGFGVPGRRHAPEAMKKIEALKSAVPEKKQAAWPAQVKVEFLEEKNEGQPKVVKWRTEREYLHEVLDKAGLSMGDFNIFYKDNSGDEMSLEVTKMGVEDFFDDHSSPARLQVIWRPLTMVEKGNTKIQTAKAWLTGQGSATDEAVKDAQDKVETNGGRVVPSRCGSGRGFIHHKGYKIECWKEAVDGIKDELNLTPEKARGLQNAALLDEGKGVSQNLDREGNKITLSYAAYSTVTHDDKIDIVYGNHVETMEVSPSGTSLPPENCIQYGGRTFSVWPPGPPHSTEAGHDMDGLHVDLPPGWQIVDSSQEGFESIRKWVIAPYGWHTIDLVTKSGETLKAWHTRRGGSVAGDFGGDLSNQVSLRGQSSFKFNTSGSYRILIEALPSASPELINHWKRYVELSAQREWSQRLSLPMAGVLSAEQQLSEPSQPSP
ncbi:Uncharacterized protein SCF082_LOCUS31106 [Durusdinium trenchii]|uniref:Uncharacterized protein n=1 Tax=Durusdinium trenchii TaxID=1381693 RepID=A0ABP0N5G8_9DINO